MLALKDLVGLHKTVQLQLLSVTGWGIDLDNCDIEWFALVTNRDHSVIFETASKYCISDSFIDYDGYSISSKGFLPTLVDIMVIIPNASKVILKILQARLQQYVYHEVPDVQARFRIGRGTRDQIANIRWIMEKAREFQKNICFCFIKLSIFDCWVTTNC